MTTTDIKPETRGLFITLEGGEGAGKSTLIAALAAGLRDAGAKVTVTREPGGSVGAEVVRHVLLSGAAQPLGGFAEALLFSAARDDHLEQVIRPALAADHIVLCDRFSDSTRAYQGAVGGIEPPLLDALEATIVGETKPDLTLVLDLPPETGLARAKGRNGTTDRFEAETLGFHRRLRDAFLAIAMADPERCAVLDASLTAKEVEAAAWRVLSARLERLRGKAA